MLTPLTLATPPRRAALYNSLDPLQDDVGIPTTREGPRTENLPPHRASFSTALSSSVTLALPLCLCTLLPCGLPSDGSGFLDRRRAEQHAAGRAMPAAHDQRDACRGAKLCASKPSQPPSTMDNRTLTRAARVDSLSLSRRRSHLVPERQGGDDDVVRDPAPSDDATRALDAALLPQRVPRPHCL